MRKFWIIAIAIVSLVAGGFLGQIVFGNGTSTSMTKTSGETQQYTCGMHPEIVTDEPGYCPICSMKLTPIRKDDKPSDSGDRKIAYWVAPMDPTFIRNEPGKSPMGMDLVPVYEDEVSGDIIKIDPVTSQNMGLKMARAEKITLSRQINTVAHIDYDKERVQAVNAKVGGWIEKLYLDYEGKSVRKGDPVLEIYSPELVAAQQEYISALKNYNQLKEASLESARQGAADLLSAARDRLTLWDISEGQIDELENTGKVRKNLTLYSPADGIVTSLNVVEGDKIAPGMKLFQVADLSSVWAIAHIFEYELPYVSLGQKVNLSLSYLPEDNFEGRISFIYPYLESKTRDVEIRIDIPNHKGLLKPNMYANATIASTLPGKRIAIPNQAVIRSGLRNMVFIALGNGKFLPREVRLGAMGQDDLIEIMSGVNDGDMVVTSSQFMLDSESRLREATSKIRAEMASVKITHDMPARQGDDNKMDNPEADMKQMKMDKGMKADPEDHSGHQHEMKNQTGDKEMSSGVYTCPMESHAHVVQFGPGKCPECGMKLVPAEETSKRTFYVCPMPQDSVVSSEPGKCPKCGMNLIEKKVGKDVVKKSDKKSSMKMEKSEKKMEISGVYTCPMDSHSHVVQMGPGKCPECGMKLVPAEETSGRTFYTCPMPEDKIVSAKPGKCPKCGMKLVEKTIKGSKDDRQAD